VERLAKLIELPPEELLAQRMAVINLAAGIDTRIVRMYEVRRGKNEWKDCTNERRRPTGGGVAVVLVVGALVPPIV
jgi:hypothetical protein